MSSGSMPSIWKCSIVCPIFKKGDKTAPTNYRPISLTSIVCKLMESIIKDDLLYYFRSNSLISPNQFAFLPKRSTCSQLLKFSNNISSQMASNTQIDTVYLDFSKAFDSIVHSKLLFKLEKYGVSNELFLWLQCFLSNRIQCVRVKNKVSSWAEIKSGVPQGSVLAPILFNIFINDIDNVENGDPNQFYIYADDVKCSFAVNSVADCISFQKTLDSISKWSCKWQLNLAPNKCTTMSFCYNNPPISFNYTINQQLLPKIDKITDLGIVFSRNLSFDDHIKQICCKARKSSAIILNCFKSRNRLLLFRAFTTYVRPILEYCTNVWSPYSLKNINLIESVQRKFTKRLQGLKDFSYSERLAHLEAESLELRRLRFGLIMYHKIIHGLVDLDFENFFCLKTSNTRSNGLALKRLPFKRNAERYIFKNRLVSIWNDLPHSIVSTSSTEAFTNFINQRDFKSYLHFNSSAPA